MSEKNPKKRLAGFTCHGLFVPIQCWVDADKQWHYDGPASCGPVHVRKNPQSVAWCGSVSSAFAMSLLATLQCKDFKVEKQSAQPKSVLGSTRYRKSRPS